MNIPPLKHLVPLMGAAILLGGCASESSRRSPDKRLVRLEMPEFGSGSDVYPYGYLRVIDYQGAVDVGPFEDRIRTVINRMANGQDPTTGKPDPQGNSTPALPPGMKQELDGLVERITAAIAVMKEANLRLNDPKRPADEFGRLIRAYLDLRARALAEAEAKAAGKKPETVSQAEVDRLREDLLAKVTDQDKEWNLLLVRAQIDADVTDLRNRLAELGKLADRSLRFVITAELRPRGTGSERGAFYLDVPGYSKGNAPLTQQGARFDLTASDAVRQEFSQLTTELDKLSKAANEPVPRKPSGAPKPEAAAPKPLDQSVADADLISKGLRAQVEGTAKALDGVSAGLLSFSTTLEQFGQQIAGMLASKEIPDAAFAQLRALAARATSGKEALGKAVAAIGTWRSATQGSKRSALIGAEKELLALLGSLEAIHASWRPVIKQEDYSSAGGSTYASYQALVEQLTGLTVDSAATAEPGKEELKKSPIHQQVETLRGIIAQYTAAIIADDKELAEAKKKAEQEERERRDREVQQKKNEELADQLAKLSLTSLNLGTAPIATNVPYLPATRITLRDTPADRGATLIIKSEVVGGDGPNPTAYASFDVERLGWSGTISAHALAVNRREDGDQQFQLAPSLSAEAGYIPWDTGSWQDVMRALKPVVGMDVIPLVIPITDNGEEKLRQTLGIGLHVGLFDGFISGGYGLDVLAEEGEPRWFWYLGFDLLGSAKPRL